MSETHYIRNLRPVAFNLRIGGRLSSQSTANSANTARVSLQLGRRYSRTDSAALSEADFKDTGVQTALNRKQIEEISEESFMTLAARPDQDDSYRDPSEPQTKKRVERDPTTLKIPAEDTPYGKTIVPEFQPEGQRYHREIPVTREDRERVRRIMSPGVDFVEEPVPTDEELAPKRKAAPKRKKSE